jgi:hypothetical protein
MRVWNHYNKEIRAMDFKNYKAGASKSEAAKNNQFNMSFAKNQESESNIRSLEDSPV